VLKRTFAHARRVARLDRRRVGTRDATARVFEGVSRLVTIRSTTDRDALELTVAHLRRGVGEVPASTIAARDEPLP
jgi:hypothetical protein